MYIIEINTDGHVQKYNSTNLNDATIFLNKLFNYSESGVITYENHKVRTIGHEEYAAAKSIIITIGNTEQGFVVGQS